MQQHRHNNINANTKGSTHMYNNISAIYMAYNIIANKEGSITSKNLTILHKNIIAIYKKKKKIKNLMHNNISAIAHHYTKSIKKYYKVQNKKNNIVENIFLSTLYGVNIFPYRPDEVAMLGCESLSTTNLIYCSVYREATYT